MLLFFRSILQEQNGITKQSNLFSKMDSKKKYKINLFGMDKQ